MRGGRLSALRLKIVGMREELCRQFWRLKAHEKAQPMKQEGRSRVESAVGFEIRHDTLPSMCVPNKSIQVGKRK